MPMKTKQVAGKAQQEQLAHVGLHLAQLCDAGTKSCHLSLSCADTPVHEAARAGCLPADIATPSTSSAGAGWRRTGRGTAPLEAVSALAGYGLGSEKGLARSASAGWAAQVRRWNRCHVISGQYQSTESIYKQMQCKLYLILNLYFGLAILCSSGKRWEYSYCSVIKSEKPQGTAQRACTHPQSVHTDVWKPKMKLAEITTATKK